MSPLAQSLLVKIFLRKRVWYNPLLHLNYDDREVAPIISELVGGKFIQTDDELLVEKALKLSSSDDESKFISEVYELLSSLTVQKLTEILKVVNQKTRNCLVPEVDVVETSPSINPFYKMPEDELSQELSQKFSALMVSEVIPKNKKRYRNWISKREAVMKVLKKLMALLKSDAVK